MVHYRSPELLQLGTAEFGNLWRLMQPACLCRSEYIHSEGRSHKVNGVPVSPEVLAVARGEQEVLHSSSVALGIPQQCIHWGEWHLWL